MVSVNFPELFASMAPVGAILLSLALLVDFFLWRSYKESPSVSKVWSLVLVGLAGVVALGVSLQTGVSRYTLNDETVAKVSQSVAKEKGYTYMGADGYVHYFMDPKTKKSLACRYALKEADKMKPKLVFMRKGDQLFPVEYSCK